MKFHILAPLYFAFVATVPHGANGYTVSWNAGSSSSAFAPRSSSNKKNFSQMNYHHVRGDMRMYEPSSDPLKKKNQGNGGNSNNNNNNNNGSNNGSNNSGGIFSALTKTEQWIAKTLATSSDSNNPYSRKEVTYVCETNDKLPAVVAGFFRRLVDARERGESFGERQEEQMAELGSKYRLATMRQTEVIVVPSCDALSSSFHDFNAVVEAINGARRSARDYVTDVSLDKLDDVTHGADATRDWSVSVNCAHLHPNFGELTPEETLAEMEKEESEGEVDLNVKEYKERRLQARRAPFPSLVIEVKATPPPDFESQSNPPPPAAASSRSQSTDSDGGSVTNADVQKLEALFGQSPAFNHPMDEEITNIGDPPSPSEEDGDDDDFYASIGKAVGIDEISFVTPTRVAQKWVAVHDPSYNPDTSTFTTASDTRHVDSAYEFVFSNIATTLAMKQQQQQNDDDAPMLAEEFTPASRTYLVMPHFLTASATSFEKFCSQVTNIIDILPGGLSRAMSISYFHPEHVEKDKRSPMPILLMQWFDASA